MTLDNFEKGFIYGAVLSLVMGAIFSVSREIKLEKTVRNLEIPHTLIKKDLNNDGNSDIIVYSGSRPTIFLANENGTYTSFASYRSNLYNWISEEKLSERRELESSFSQIESNALELKVLGDRR